MALPISPHCLFIGSDNEESIAKLSRYNKKKLAEQANISSIQQAQAKAFAVDARHSMRLFERRLGKLHSILPSAKFI